MAVVLLIIAGVAFSALSGGENKNSPALTPTTQTAVIATATEAPATPTTAPTSTATLEPTPVPTLGIGSTMISEKDGMTLLYVPAGDFTMGSNDGFPDERPVHKVTLDAFWIDQTEVTNKMYALCVTASACQLPTDLGSITRSSYYGNLQYDNYPVINVDWNMAKAYCAWAGRRLPTETEWEKAARGTDQRTYPWGFNAPDNTLLNFNQVVGDTTEAGKYPNGASPYGALDMAGNVWEWVADWYSDAYYASSPTSNPSGPSSGDGRVQRGGSWNSGDSGVRSAYRTSDSPVEAYSTLGFRCSRGISP
jgi:eukaryotic-like serine/threonine-protein kinase